jgi:SAM-dependent methyltransferase
LTRFLARHPGHGRRVLVPGRGFGHEIRAFADAGYQVTAIDFAHEAIARVRRLCGPRREVELICGDSSRRTSRRVRSTLSTSAPSCVPCPSPAVPRWAARTAHWVKPGGHVAGLYYHGPKDHGSPFGLERDEAERLFGTHFELIDDEEIPARETLPLFAGSERWQVRRRLTTA